MSYRSLENTIRFGPIKDDVDSISEDKQLSLYKYNKRSGMWDYQRSVTPETKDQWLHIFKKDEPNDHFVVSKNKPKNNPLKEEKDYEGQMARAQLQIIAQRASALADMMKDDMQLEAWVQSKITTAEDYVTTVHDYMTTRKGN